MYSDRFKSTEDLIVHLDVVIGTLPDPYIKSKYAGFLAINCVAVLELAFKDIVIEFGRKKHKVFGVFCSSYFDRINGRISLKDLKDEHIRKFGEKYNQRFLRNLDKLDDDFIKTKHKSIKAGYGNLIVWRHRYAHEGEMPANATYEEVKWGFESGKHIMKCLSGSMTQ